MPLVITQGYGSPSGAGPGAFVLNSVTVTENYLDLTFSSAATISGPASVAANWVLTPLNGGFAGQVISVQNNSGVIRLFITELTNTKIYQITIPVVGITSGSSIFLGIFNPQFNAVAAAPTFLLARVIDARTVEVTFSKPMIQSDIVTPGDYSISPPLSVTGVTFEANNMVLLKTNRQTRVTTYTITGTNMRSIGGNSV